MDTPRSILLDSLANTIADYRQNEIAPITTFHVERWLNQFDAVDQPTILSEMDSIMKRFYFSRLRVKECIRNFLKESVIRTNDPTKLLPHISFLNIQKSGSSQGAMLGIADEVLREEYNFPLSMTGVKEVQVYIYIDDCIYTGSKLRYNLTDGKDSIGWFSTCPSAGCTLWVYTIAGHTEGMDYVRKYVLDAAKEKQVKVQRKTTLMINNVRKPGNDIEILWPERLQGDPDVDFYVSDLWISPAYRGDSNDLFRDDVNFSQETLFSSLEARRVVEKAFLKKGIQIIKTNKNPAPSVRPLGFMKLVSLGFGTFFVTYRNIANNCPLVLWWGEPGFSPTHPLGKWYPLFPRRTNEQRDILVQRTNIR